MNVALIIPTGIGAEIGGHAGDANPVAKLLAGVADTLITHPNVVNASDINEMPENVWYVDGAMLDGWLTGHYSLRRPLQNRILVVANSPLKHDTINAVNAAYVTIGIDVTLIALNEPLRMVASFQPYGQATGQVTGDLALIDQVSKMSFDALAIHTPIECPRDVAVEYFKNGGVNPWGGVEAVASRAIGEALGKPVAHAPQETITPDDPELWGVLYQSVDQRMAPEAIANTYLHSVLKGLNRAPRMSGNERGLHVDDLDAIVMPWGAQGIPNIEAENLGIPVIAVRENTTIYNDPNFYHTRQVENYWEAAGVLMCMKAGVTPGSVRKHAR